MRLPTIQGLIRRRLLVNFRADAEVVARLLPAPIRPKLHRGLAIAGICIIRLEEVRPLSLPTFLGTSAENAAHRIAVEWDDEEGKVREGVYIPRRDTSSWFNHAAGGRLFAGEQHLADFQVVEDNESIEKDIRSQDGSMSIHLHALETESLPESSCFGSLSESSAFFEGGAVDYSATREGRHFDGIRLVTDHWVVKPLAVKQVESSFFSDQAIFPEGSITFDHALIMRNIPHQWHGEPDMVTA